jgi:hypothetical protein
VGREKKRGSGKEAQGAAPRARDAAAGGSLKSFEGVSAKCDNCVEMIYSFIYWTAG